MVLWGLGSAIIGGPSNLIFAAVELHEPHSFCSGLLKRTSNMTHITNKPIPKLTKATQRSGRTAMTNECEESGEQ